MGCCVAVVVSYVHSTAQNIFGANTCLVLQALQKSLSARSQALVPAKIEPGNLSSLSTSRDAHVGGLKARMDGAAVGEVLSKSKPNAK
jgi:hypothetical protein